MRESSDYEVGAVFEEDEVKSLVKNAEDFLKLRRSSSRKGCKK